MPFSRRKTQQHEKSMGSYELFAWRDAQEIANILITEIGYSQARQSFEKAGPKQLRELERKNHDVIADFIKKTATQRLSFLRKLQKQTDDETCSLFLILAVLGALRAKETIELRDRYRHILVPGQGNRVTTAAMYEFTNEILDTFTYNWPGEVFDDLYMDIDEDTDESNTL